VAGRYSFAKTWHFTVLWCAVSLLLLSAVVGPAVAQTCVPPPAGIIAWWPGDTNANDISGNINHAQLQNGATAGATGHVGGAFQFDGVDDVADTPLLLPAQGTIELWVKLTSLTVVHGILGTVGHANGSDRLWIVVEGPLGGFVPNTLRVNLGNRVAPDIVIPVPNSLWAGEWTHLVVTFNYNTDVYALYVNGNQEASFTAARDTPTQAVSFGGVTSDFGQHFFLDGRMDEVTVYDRILSEGAILDIFNAGSEGKCTPPPDTDGDGVPDDQDACPASDLSTTVVIGGCDSAVTNTVFPSGCTMNDLMTDCADGATNHQQVDRCIAKLTDKMEQIGIITSGQKAAIQHCL
jgi:hypothetical protein